MPEIVAKKKVRNIIVKINTRTHSDRTHIGLVFCFVVLLLVLLLLFIFVSFNL